MFQTREFYNEVIVKICNLFQHEHILVPAERIRNTKKI